MKNIDGRQVYSISEANYFAKQTLEQMILWVEGEVSTLRKNPNYNFYYLDLKDSGAVLPAVADGYMIEELGEDIVGQSVLVYGNLSLYEPYGKYQFRVSKIEAFGDGLLQKKLDELIAKLKGEGLFDEKFKKPMPVYPQKVCLITSEGSDAYNDFITHSVKKFPLIELFTIDVRVQGKNAVKSIIKALKQAEPMGFDAIVLTRGGGSLEDLAAFNDEKVAREIFEMKTPVIAGIGHEADESIAEYVADVRASTPTDAARIVVQGYSEVLERLENFSYRISSKSSHFFSQNLQRLDHFYFTLQQTKVAFKDLPHRLELTRQNLLKHEKHAILDNREHLSELFVQLERNIKIQLQAKKTDVESAKKSLSLLSFESTLKRGYSIAQNSKGHLIRSSRDVAIGEIIDVRLADGSLTGKVKSKTWQKEKNRI